MFADFRRPGRFGRSLRCRSLVWAALAGMPLTSVAAPARSAQTPDVATFDAGFRAGQNAFNRGEYIVAAEIWVKAAVNLPENAEQRENRAAVYEYIAEAYLKGIGAGADKDLVREALFVLDSYAARFSAAHPGKTLSPQVLKARAAFRAMLVQVEPTRAPPEESQDPAPAPAALPALPTLPAPQPVARRRAVVKPWKGLLIGGGIATGGGVAMLVMLSVEAARANAREREFDDPANGCKLDAIQGDCADIDRGGRIANSLAITGAVAGPLLLGGGVAMLVLGFRRKNAQRRLSPTVTPTSAGLLWQQQF